MELTLRQKILIFGGLGLLLVVIIFAVLFSRQEPEPVDTSVYEVPEDPYDSQESEYVAPVYIPEVLEDDGTVASDLDDEVRVKQVARTFVERFATKSNQNNSAHVDDALLLATESMASWVRTQGSVEEVEYSGVTTRVIAASVRSLENGVAIVGIEAQQTMRSKNGGEEKINKTGRVELVVRNGDWLVDGFWWE